MTIQLRDCNFTVVKIVCELVMKDYRPNSGLFKIPIDFIRADKYSQCSHVNVQFTKSFHLETLFAHLIQPRNYFNSVC